MISIRRNNPFNTESPATSLYSQMDSYKAEYVHEKERQIEETMERIRQQLVRSGLAISKVHATRRTELSCRDLRPSLCFSAHSFANPPNQPRRSSLRRRLFWADRASWLAVSLKTFGGREEGDTRGGNRVLTEKPHNGGRAGRGDLPSRGEIMMTAFEFSRKTGRPRTDHSFRTRLRKTILCISSKPME